MKRLLITGCGDVVLRMVHFAPTPSQGTQDTRTAHRLAPLTTKRKILPHRLICISTSGVHGNCGSERKANHHACGDNLANLLNFAIRAPSYLLSTEVFL
jgi:hypothetical protein